MLQKLWGKPSKESDSHHDNSVSVPKDTAIDNGSFVEAQDKDVILEGLGSVAVYDQWGSLSITGRQPKARYEHAAAVVQEKMVDQVQVSNYMNQILRSGLMNLIMNF